MSTRYAFVFSWRVARSDSHCRDISLTGFSRFDDRHQAAARRRQVKPIWQAGCSGSSCHETE